MVDKYVEGVIPERDEDMIASLTEITRTQFAGIFEFLEELNFSDFLRDLWGFLRWVDSFVTGKAPWRTPEGIPEDALLQYRSDVIYTASDCVRVITALLYPILPYATAQVWSQLELGDIEVAAKNGELKDLNGAD